MATVTLIMKGKKESEDLQLISPGITNVHIKTVQNLTGIFFLI